MRVLFAIGSMRGGGAERQTIHYLRNLDRERFAPALYVTSQEGELLAEVPAGVPVTSYWGEHVAPARGLPGRLHFQQAAHLAQVLDEQEIDVLCAITFHTVLQAGRSVRRRPTPWLAVEMADPRFSSALQEQRFPRIKHRLLSRAYRHADRCVAVSEGVRQGIEEMYGVDPERIAVLPNFIDLAAIDRQCEEAGPDLDATQFHLACVGRLDVQKGHQFLLRAAEQLVNQHDFRQLHLHFLGQGPLEEQLRQEVDRARLTAHVTFAGFQRNPHAYVRKCQLFCLPSLFEGLPLALLEAMACRVPVLAADCPSGPAEILRGGQFGTLVPPGDADALAEAICGIMKHYPDAAERVPAARERVQSHYSVPVGIARLQQLFQDVAAGRRIICREG